METDPEEASVTVSLLDYMANTEAVTHPSTKCKHSYCRAASEISGPELTGSACNMMLVCGNEDRVPMLGKP